MPKITTPSGSQTADYATTLNPANQESDGVGGSYNVGPFSVSLVGNAALANPVQFVNPDTQGTVPPNAGQPLTTTKDASGKTISIRGQVPGTSVVITNPG